MESQTNFFHHLPDEVTQLVFSRINDHKTLVQCMSVSRSFRQHAARVPSLSIVCPGSFSSYDERLHRILAMVKAFKNLQSLVVRVGQPREEPPSWARCMRYAEIGGSVEKFMFMAAKSGDFSELDSTLMGLDSIGGKSQEGVSNRAPSAALLETIGHPDFNRRNSLERSNNGNSIERNRGPWSDVESEEMGAERVPEGSILGGGSKQTQEEKSYLESRSSSSNSSIKRNPLSQFTLRQVIAPSNDVLKRMLPVIHFAIVQGLNELRDSLPAFVAQFSELRAFLLVDMVESITVFMREHHIQELKSSYMQELDEFPNLAEEAPKVEQHLSQICLREYQGKGMSCRDEGGEHMDGLNRNGNHSEGLDSRCMNCTHRTEHVMYSDDITFTEGSSLRSSKEEPQSSSAKMLATPLFHRYDRERSQASKGKEKLTEEFDSQWKGRVSVSDSSCLNLGGNNCSNIVNIDCPGEGSSLGGCSSPSNDGPIDLERWHSATTYPSVGETPLESHSCLGPLEAFGGTSYEHSTLSEAVAEDVDWDGSLDCQGDGHAKARANGYRLQGNKCPRDLKVDLTNKYSLRRCHKPDTWRKKDCTSLRFFPGIRGTGGLPCSSFPEESVDVERSEMLACEDAFDKDEELLRDDMTWVGDGNDDTSRLSSVRSTACAGDVHDCVDECARDNREGLSVEGSQRTEQRQGNHGSIGPSQALESEVHVRRLVQIDSWQERVRKLRESLHVGQAQELHQTRDYRELQPLELEAPDPLEERAVRADSWRHVWQERVRRLRGSLHMDASQELDRTYESRRERLRDLVVRKRHRAMEKDALSFDYTFWRAEQVSSCNYVMSDISMCIATNAARPLKDAEKEELIQAAIAGPLLVATVSHVNKHYNCHHL